jgi:outer membrane murein-binding lipoprotein Lpp
MSELPAINYQFVAQKLSTKVSDLVFQNIQLEVLAEGLRDERDAAKAEVSRLQTHTPDA